MSAGVKLVLAAIIVAIAVAVPLVLKHRGQSEAEAEPGSGVIEAATPPPASPDSDHASLDGAAKSTVAATVTAPRPTTPRFVDLGTETCAPCRVMLGVMKELERRHPETLRVEFVNIQKDKGSAERYGVKVIPTQIFYSPEDRELFRHQGIMRTDVVVAKWKALGYDLNAPAEGR